jgi:L-glutamine:scyllo-inosose aminotransferase/L-glutamine:2-deoxy-scyllo-inosose/3-amino-2,3-dideoxy-scyllo-inosose aminotransferase
MPVPVDVCADSLCVDPTAAGAAIATTCPRAMVVVHQNCAIAAVEELVRIADASSVQVIEDCSQAHGARIGERPVGTFGVAATFSFQQNKLLTCGEGGAVATSDDAVYRCLQQYHAVGRTYTEDASTGATGLAETGEVIGDSVVMSEFHAAVLLDQLDRFDEQHRRRTENVRRLEALLDGCDWLTALTASPAGASIGYHKYTWRLDRSALHGVTSRSFARALGAELGRDIGLVDACFDRNPLLDRDAQRARLFGREVALAQARVVGELVDVDLPVASAARESCIHLRHDAFLGESEDMADVAEAMFKVARHSATLAAAAEA